MSRAQSRGTLYSALGLLAAFGFATETNAQNRPPTNVIVDAVVRRPVEDKLSIIGRARPKRSSLLATESDGKVVSKVIEEGNRAKIGDIILKLENQQLESSLLEARADLDLQQFNFKHTEELYKQDVVPEQSLNEARYQLARARAKFSDLGDRVEKLNIRAPYPG